MVLSPKESANLISKLASHVTIKEQGIEKLSDQIAHEINSGRLGPEQFSQNNVHPKAEDPWALDWLFVVDTLNFCFWHNENELGWKVEGQTGYFALCTAINRALKEGIDILNPKLYATITDEQLSKILRSDNEIPVPLLTERVKALHETGSCLLEKYNGTFTNCVKEANNSAVALLRLIVENFRCYRDESNYKNNRVAFYKRAQILIGDIWACFRGKGIGYFEDINQITMFADYRVPQSLLYFGVLAYSDQLLEKLSSNTVLPNGDEMEVEIRGCSIHAVEILREYVEKKIDKSRIVNSILIDHFLWDFRRQRAQEILKMQLPFHKTFCIYY